MLSITTDKNNVKDGDTVTLECTVPDFLDNIFVSQYEINRAVGLVGQNMVSLDESAYTVRTSGTQIIFKINSFSKTRDVGSWFVRYGTSTYSKPINLSAFIEGEDDTEDGLSPGEDDTEDGLSPANAGSITAGTILGVGGIAATVFAVITCRKTKHKTIHAESGTHFTFGYNIPNAGEAVWTKNGKTFEVYPMDNVDEKGTVLQIHEALPKDSGLYVCSYGPNSEKLKYDLIIKENKKPIHAEIGTHVTLGYKIPNAGETVWTKNGYTFKDYPIGNVEVNGTVLQIHEAWPKDSGLYVCSYGPNSEKLKYDLIIKELEKKDSADSS